ncbi:hypothetical protein BJ138DRAFT_1062811 [Hygrophoropsis aurantiaca]|uniref:Uncharacterized protein n=1 Tax=Hygrophoropsis aurantiaca TaxID=72124 RepID=A0ACB8AEB3_9AGAM|nr:hypothetical protein BJ138DRAFT_1062811 [Hygrophoropsis aurantiaca]
MPRENSFSDSEGRSLTPDLSEDEFMPPTSPVMPHTQSEPIPPTMPASPVPRVSYSHSQPRPSLAAQMHTSPKDRFRASVRKIIHMHRTSTILSSRTLVGAEPGVDPRRQSAFLQYGHLRQNSVIELADYSTLRASFGRMTNREFVQLLTDKNAGDRESWVKVRWINVCGISWDVISELAIKYDLHPLALEDVLHQRARTRSKTDYYPRHLFIRVLCHTLAHSDANSDASVSKFIPSDDDNLSNPRRRATSPGQMTSFDYNRSKEGGSDIDEEESNTVLGSSTPGHTTWRGRSSRSRKGGIVKRRGYGQMAMMHNTDLEAPTQTAEKPPTIGFGQRKDTAARRRREKAQASLEELKKEGRVNVNIQPISIFLLRDGTVISIMPQDYLDFAAPIIARLRQKDTGLRASADPSMLVQSLLDLVVDSAMEVVDAYHEKVLELEHAVLLKPNMKVVQQLHILSGDLTLHKRTLEPLKTVIYGLRRYDLDRCAALVDPHGTHGNVPAKVEGFMSHKSKIYLADVYDHMEYILTSLDMFAGIAENLINFTFNVKSYEMNEVMRRLTLATIIFLPLTLLTGYFGMNFDYMWAIQHNHSDVVFWIIALPVMAIVVPIFTLPDIRRILHYMKKRFGAGRQTKTIKRD